MNRIDDTTIPQKGRYYLVPCVRFRAPYHRKDYYVPVFDNYHEDKELIGFKYHHYHVDMRFIPRNNIHGFFVGTAIVNYFDKDGNEHLGITTNAKVEAMIYWIRRKCYQSENARYPETFHNLQEAFIGKKLLPGDICPHRGHNLAPANKLKGGCRECPLHGLHFNEQGICVPRSEASPQSFDQHLKLLK